MEVKQMVKCLECNNDVVPGKRKKRKFCNRICQTRYNARASYERLKSNPAYKLRCKIRLKKWIDENRDHFNDLMREPNRIRQAKLKKEREKQGVCLNCGKEIDMFPFDSYKRKECIHCRVSYIVDTKNSRLIRNMKKYKVKR